MSEGEAYMTMKSIRIELARSPGVPEGDAGHAYEFRAPLDQGGSLDRASWPGVKQLCTVRRFLGGDLCKEAAEVARERVMLAAQDRQEATA